LDVGSASEWVTAGVQSVVGIKQVLQAIVEDTNGIRDRARRLRCRSVNRTDPDLGEEVTPPVVGQLDDASRIE
jgi:hypothetical protein